MPVLVACARGALKFWWRTGVRARRRSVAALLELQRRGCLLVDHGLALPGAELAFVHNVAAEAARHLPHGVAGEAVRREQEYFAALRADAVVVANSRLVAAALEARFGIARERLVVLYPGYCARRFSPQRAAALRAPARASLGIAADAPLVGLVTSGDFPKRGLDVFLDAAARIAAARRDVRFLVVGSKRLPDDAREHALVRDGTVLYRPKGSEPDRCIAALDVFLYPALFEEFGMVVAEAQASGVPVLTSRTVGASECLPPDYAPWLLERPEAEAFAERTLALLDDADARNLLSQAALASIGAFDERAYAAGTRRLLEQAQKPRLK